MDKKLSIYIGLILIGLSITNGNITRLYSFVRQKILLNSINQETTKLCYPLQRQIEKYVYNFRNNISISVLTNNGQFIVDVNSSTPRIPASNQKILSSAYALDNLGPNYTLKTSLNLINKGDLYLESSGDPDLNNNHLIDLVSVLKSRKYIPINKTPIIIKSIDSINWWPSSWSQSDRKEEYGAPITQYSISSNASSKAIYDPILNFKKELESALSFHDLSNQYFVKIVDNNFIVNYKSTLNTVESAPLYALLNLVNSESHNFTSEVLFRNSLGNWSHVFPNKKYSKWLKKQNIKSAQFVFKDASGLSRRNRVTTYGLAQFLRRMKSNRHSGYYFSSFSILGVRGSLSRVDAPLNLKGKILAKSGTLTNVKSVSGIILSNDLIFSIIINDMDNSLNYIVDILSILDSDKVCN